jgi:peptide/nickel transport system ATP-binding protein
VDIERDFAPVPVVVDLRHRGSTTLAIDRSESATEAVGRGPAPVARIKDLSVSFRRRGHVVRSLRGVSLDIRPGEVLGLVGESGSGKSVLGASILGLLPEAGRPTVSGSIDVGGTEVLSAGQAERRRLRRSQLGAVFQDPMTSLNPTMRVGRQLQDACSSREEAISLLEAVGVPEPERRLRSYPHELSGGLRQRVMIALALAGNPRLVIADEPTTALDVTVQAQILDLVRRLCDERGTSFLFVTHDLGVAAEVADRIAVLYAGRLVELGDTRSLLASPAHPYTSGLMQSRLTLWSERARPLATLAGEPPDPRALPPGCGFAPRCEHHQPACDDGLPALLSVGAKGRFSACIRHDDLHLVGAEPEEVDRLDGLGGSDQLVVDPVVDPVVVGQAATAEPSGDGREGRTMALEVIGVSKSFAVGHHPPQLLHALRDVSLDVVEGESLALVGESGSGKSTLLRLAGGLLRPDEGEIRIGPGARPQMVFQDAGASLTPWLTVGELVGGRLRGEGLSRRQRARRVEDALRLVGLPVDVAAAKPGQLSGGQRQRVGIARAVIVPPEVLLCDEPTSALDVSLAASALNLLARLRREFNMAMVFVTHDLAAARFVSDRIAVLYLGMVVETGSTDDVVSHPSHPYTRALLDAVPGHGKVPTRLAGDPASAIDPPSGCSFHPRCTEAKPACAEHAPTLAGQHGRAVACLERHAPPA